MLEELLPRTVISTSGKITCTPLYKKSGKTFIQNSWKPSVGSFQCYCIDVQKNYYNFLSRCRTVLQAQLYFKFCEILITKLQFQFPALNSFLAKVSILYPLKKPEKQRFSYVSRGYKTRTLARNGLKKAIRLIIHDGDPYHIETSPFVIAISVKKEIKKQLKTLIFC